jgi:hypothetical protein
VTSEPSNKERAEEWIIQNIGGEEDALLTTGRGYNLSLLLDSVAADAEAHVSALTEERDRLREALVVARAVVNTMDEDELGWSYDERDGRTSVKGDVLLRIDAALSAPPAARPEGEK